MFVRVKSTPNSPKKFVQIVESIRKGDKVSQKIVRHIGYALEDAELKQLKFLAESIKVKLEAGDQMLLFTPEQLAHKKKDKQIDQKTSDKDYKVNLKDLIEEQRLVNGIHDVHGSLFDEFGYQNIFKNPARQKALVNIFRDIVMARIANPVSKRASVDMLEEDFGINLDLHRVYRMMDKLDDQAIEDLNKITYQKTVDLFGGTLDVIFIDTTTIYFESFDADDLRDFGFSKDLKFNQPQVLLSLLVTKEGLPVAYQVFPGSTYEGHTLIPSLKELRQKYKIDKVIMVADSGLFNNDNVTALENEGFEYIVGARLKNMTKAIQQKILNKQNYKQVRKEYSIAEILLEKERKLIVSYKGNRARKDANDRIRAIKRLEKKLSKQKNPKNYLSNYGYKKYLKVIGETHIEFDQDKIKQDQEWDGLHGVITNAKDLNNDETLSQYTQLWQVEEAFRINKHDLKVRPVFHWTSSRVKAHFAICFCCYALVKHLAYRIKLQYKSLSIERIRQKLVRTQTSILFDQRRKIRYGLPSRITRDVKKIYKLMNITKRLTPYMIK
jgi:transposase